MTLTPHVITNKGCVRDNSRRIIAFEASDSTGMSLDPAPRSREWMQETDQEFAMRCLPLLMANQAGWFIANPATFTVKWNGGTRKEDTTIQFDGGNCDSRVRSHFGHGILTFTLPYLFRTPSGINLLVKGPSNQIKDGIQALEGIVETDWAISTFTMNWKLTRIDCNVQFCKGEPICMILPLHRGYSESLEPELRPLQESAQLYTDYHEWRSRRNEFLAALANQERGAMCEGWQRDYFKGVDMRGNSFEDHQSRVVLRKFQSEKHVSTEDQNATLDPSIGTVGYQEEV